MRPDTNVWSVVGACVTDAVAALDMLNTQGTSTTSVPGVPAAVMNLSAT